MEEKVTILCPWGQGQPWTSLLPGRSPFTLLFVALW